MDQYKKSIGELTHSFCLHMLSTICRVGSNPLNQKYKTYAYLDRTILQNA